MPSSSDTRVAHHRLRGDTDEVKGWFFNLTDADDGDDRATIPLPSQWDTMSAGAAVLALVLIFVAAFKLERATRACCERLFCRCRSRRRPGYDAVAETQLPAAAASLPPAAVGS